MPVVEGHVLVAQERMDDLLAGEARQLRHGVVQTSWCWTATSGTGTPAIAPTVGPQIAGAQQDALALDPALVGLDRVHAPPVVSNPVTVTPPSNATPFASAFRASAVTIRTAFAMPSDGTRYAPRMCAAFSSGSRLGGLGRRQQLGALDAVGAREAVPALQLLDALGRRRDLERADPVPAPGSPSRSRPS